MELRSLLALVTAFILASIWGPTVLAQQRLTLPSQQHATLQAQSELDTTTLPPVNVARLKAEDRDKRSQITPYRYGKVVDTNYRPEQDGTWEKLPSGDGLWRLRIQSEKAVSLSLGFSRFELPEGASLFVYDPEGTLIRGPYTHSDATNGELWTPLVHGEQIIVELEVPANKRDAVSLVLGSVVHGYRPLPSRRSSSTAAKSGACNLDVSCDEANDWNKQVRSVGGYTLTRGEDNLFCSGALINNTGGNNIPYFLTAEHCVSRPFEASTMVFYWNFQTAQCREQGSTESGQFPSDSLSVGDWAQTSSGAILQARYGNVHETGGIAGKSDLTLVEIDDEIPADYNLYLSGWNRSGTPPNASTTIHHPRGHGKRISFDRDPSSLIGYPSTRTCQAPSGDTHFLIEDWEVGTTQRGSSGSPLFNENKNIVGVLSGGCAGCGGGGVDDNNDPDWYGRLANGFTKGDYQGRTLADVLDPSDSGTTTLSGRPFVRPTGVSDFRLVEVTSDSATLRWKAPQHDASAPTPEQYDLRARPNLPIRTKSDFEDARRIDNVPPIGPPGTTQEVTIALNPDTTFYFALRTLAADQDASSSASSQAASVVSKLQVTRKPGPNPASDRITFGLTVEQKQSVRVDLYDIMGRRVRTLFDESIQPFRQRTVSTRVSSLSSGVYFLRIRGESTAHTEKIVVTR